MCLFSPFVISRIALRQFCPGDNYVHTYVDRVFGAWIDNVGSFAFPRQIVRGQWAVRQMVQGLVQETGSKNGC
jgi:hypothetical protein